MDSSTITFIGALVVAFIFLRWFVSSDDGESDVSVTNGSQSTSSPSSPNREANPYAQQRRRPVTSDMVEVVQSLAPHLTASQIRYDLQQTGSVQETVDKFLRDGTLPFPPGEEPRAVPSANEDLRNKQDNIKPENLLKKYNIDGSSVTSSSDATTSNSKVWSNSADERSKSLQEKKTEMILKARRRLEAQLKNEQDLSALTK